MTRRPKWIAVAAGSVLALVVSSQAIHGGGQGRGEAVAPGRGRGAATEVGFGLFQQRCLSCHGNASIAKAPAPAVLREMTPERILDALTTGVMKPIGDTLTETERGLVAESVAGRLLGTSTTGDAQSMPNRCAGTQRIGASRPSWNGWGADVENTRFQPARAAGLQPRDVPRLTLKWAFGFPNGTSSYGQPTIFAGRVFVGTDTGYLYSLDARSGCAHWSFQTKAGVRNAPSIGPIETPQGARFGVYVGDVKANVYGVDAETGVEIWTTHVESHYTARVTGAPTLYEGRLYVPISSWEEFSARTLDYPCCTSRGAIAALNATTGEQIWKTYVVEDPKPTRKNSKGVQLWAPAGASIWNSPTIDAKRRLVYAGTGDATTYPAAKTSDAIVAFDLDTGAIRWSYQVHEHDSFLVGCNGNDRTENCPETQGPDWDIPASVVLRNLPNRERVLLVGTKPGDVLALDPDRDGHVRWRINVNGGGVVGNGPTSNGPSSGTLWGFAADPNTAYFGLTGGAIAAVDIATGYTRWHVRPAGADARVSYGSATTAIPGVVFQGGSDGTLLALSAVDGATLWSFNTNRPFDTVNHVAAKGGSISAPGATVADGVVFVGSGYAVLGGTPGNVLLAFGLP